ncbi:MAG: type IV pilin protein, partial [Verrucomicrobiota bacterium]
MKKRKRNRAGGFTLIELLLVVAILSILATVV